MTDRSRQDNDIRVAERRPRWWIPDIVLFGMILLPNAVLGPFGLTEYIAGRRNDPVLAYTGAMWWLVAWVAALILLIATIIRMSLVWRQHIDVHGKLYRMRLAIGLGLLLYLALPFAPVLPSGVGAFMYGFEGRMKSKADIQAIQAWLGTVDPNERGAVLYRQRGGANGGDAMVTLPESIARLSPQYVHLLADDARRPTVRLGWSMGPFASWGLVVGDRSMATPPSDLSLHGEFRAELCKGAYVWHDIQ